MINISHISNSFNRGQHFVVNDVSLTVKPGETLILLGSSGCGKTTLLKMINRLIKPTTGSIEIDGKNINDYPLEQLRHSIGYVFQGIGLFPHMTIEKNIAIVLKIQGQSKKIYQHRAHELLEMIDLNPKQFAQRYPDELSGGQQQRVGVARALAADPNYLLMDEPFGALDAITRDDLQTELIKLRDRLKKTIIFVTHDIFEALRLGDRIAVMHQGKLEQIGTKDELIHHPASEFVQQLVEKNIQSTEKYL